MAEQLKIQEEQPKNKIETLKEKGIVSFDVELTPEEKDGIQEIKIEKALPQFNYYGPANEELIRKLTAHLSQLEGNTEEVINSISSLVAKVAEGMQKDFNKESAWVMVRVTMPNNEFDIPRWHQDGYYIKSKEGTFKSEEKTYKLVFTVKGAPTRFAAITDAEKYKQLDEESTTNNRLNYDNNRKKYDEEDIAIREKFVSAVEETDPISKDQATMYLVGDEDAKVHSEPPMDTPRIFMSVVPGSVEQIEEFRERYEK